MGYKSHGKRPPGRLTVDERLAALPESELDRLEALLDLERQSRDPDTRATGQLLRPDEVADRLNVARATVYRLFERGALRAVKIGDGPRAHLRVDPTELELYIRRTTIGHDLHARANRIMEIRGDDPADAAAYRDALRAAGGHDYITTDRIARAIEADVDAAEADGYFAQASPPGSSAVDTEAIIRAELDRLPSPWPPPIAKLGPSGIGQAALRILDDKGIGEYGPTEYTAAVRQAILDATNQKRTV